MRNTALKIAYIGDEFYGLQRQPDNPTVEGELIRVLKKLKIIDKMEIARIRLGGRTDRGVHSLGNVISVFSEWDIHINQINHQLNDDIVIIAKVPVRFGFKPRYAQQRHYRYYFPKDILSKIDLESLNQLPSIFEGTHDFTNFTKKNPKTPVRTIDKIAINTENGFYVDVYGESFLWNMVRKMMRVFLDVGLNNMDLDDVKDLFDPNIQYNIKPLPPESLILMDIKYDKIKFQYDDYALEMFKRRLSERMINYENKINMTKNIIGAFDKII